MEEGFFLEGTGQVSFFNIREFFSFDKIATEWRKEGFLGTLYIYSVNMR